MPALTGPRSNISQLFTTKQKDALLSKGVRQEYRRKSYLFYRDDPGTALYIVKKGQVTVSLKTSNGREIILDTFTENDLIGEISLLDDGPRMADAFAHKDTTVIIIQKKAFLDFLRSHPDAYQAITKLLCRRIRTNTQFLEDLFHDNILKRTVSKLLSLSEKSNKTSESLIEITQEDLSKMLGSSREVINRQLQLLQERGLIFIKRGAILVPDIKKLRYILHTR